MQRFSFPCQFLCAARASLGSPVTTNARFPRAAKRGLILVCTLLLPWGNAVAQSETQDGPAAGAAQSGSAQEESKKDQATAGNEEKIDFSLDELLVQVDELQEEARDARYFSGGFNTGIGVFATAIALQAPRRSSDDDFRKNGPILWGAVGAGFLTMGALDFFMPSQFERFAVEFRNMPEGTPELTRKKVEFAEAFLSDYQRGARTARVVAGSALLGLGAGYTLAAFVGKPSARTKTSYVGSGILLASLGAMNLYLESEFRNEPGMETNALEVGRLRLHPRFSAGILPEGGGFMTAGLYF